MIIAFEGGDGYGKTRHALSLAEYAGFGYVKLPNEYLPSGKTARAMINGQIPFDKLKYQIVQNENKLETLETLTEGNYIFDRYKLSEIVYGLVNGLPEQVVRDLAEKLPDPDITVLLMGKPYRVDSDIFSSRDYQRQVKELFFEESKRADGRIIRICNYGSIEEVFDRILRELRGVVHGL